jgi:hypothetical protein
MRLINTMLIKHQDTIQKILKVLYINTLVYLTEAGTSETISLFSKLLVANWDVSPTRTFTWNCKRMLNHSTVNCTQYLKIMSKFSKTSFNVYVTLECSKDPSGYHPHASLGGTAESVRFPTMLMKHQDTIQKILKVLYINNMTHTMWPNNRHTCLPHRGRN